ncbi:MAG: glycosyltransferase family 4 protein [Burkholderiaceae bacterium]
MQAGGDSGAAAQGRVIRWYAAVRRRLPMNGVAMRLLKSLAWRFLVDLENFYTRLYAPTITGLRADVVVAHDLPMLPVAVDAAARRGAKLVYDNHELFVEQGLPRWLSRRWRRLEASLIGRADAVITVNESIARELERRYGLARVHVILNAERALAPAARAPTGRLRAALGLPASARVLLYQGADVGATSVLVSSMARVRTVPSTW